MKHQSSITGKERGGLEKNEKNTGGLGALIVFFCSVASLATTLENISFSSLPGDRFEVKMDFDSKPLNQKGYNIDKPARVVMDFEGVESALKKNTRFL
ncbi:MAG: hypothetical protein R3E63_10455 [Pseudomonadales bacterium]